MKALMFIPGFIEHCLLPKKIVTAYITELILHAKHFIYIVTILLTTL